MDSISGFESLALPRAKVMAYQKEFILWEKLTALHQFSTQEKEPPPNRLARHWYDVDCLLNMNFADPLNSDEAMQAVIEMKKYRWASPGVDCEAILQGQISLIPEAQRLESITKDHEEAVSGGMFFTKPGPFEAIAERLNTTQKEINDSIQSTRHFIRRI
ncbi:hypothetical protein ND16A_1855 [Thalassotalea sp. ND16A]|nr:hypothetical protein ND16A_1855 [Thalassotalea sp. ND16A]